MPAPFLKVVPPSYRIYFKFTKIGGASGSTKNLRVLNYREFGHPGSTVYRKQTLAFKHNRALLVAAQWL